jgi:hypothetical protein
VIRPASAANAGGYFGKEGDNQGFYVLGPVLDPVKEKSPFLPPMEETLRRPEMSYITKYATPDGLLKPSLLWQRLACPHLPPQHDPTKPFYNPYITVDYVRHVTPNYAAAIGDKGPNNPPPTPASERHSQGRKQPYAAGPSQLVTQEPKPPLADQPQHTFFQHNDDSATPGPNWHTPPKGYPPFDWLVHLDRQLISPIELLHVSAFKPHELTQQFRTGDQPQQRYAHRAPWLEDDLAGSSPPKSHRLYRALEFLGTHSRFLGMMAAGTTSAAGFPPPDPEASYPLYPNQVVIPGALSGTTANGGTWRIEPGCTLAIDRGLPSEEVVRVKAVVLSANPPRFVADFLKPHGPGFTITPTTVSERVPGRINLNTVWDEETFQALCDANPSNGFTSGLAKAAFQNLLMGHKQSRTPDPKGVPGPHDRPFRSLTSGLTPAGYTTGWLQDTVLRFNTEQLGHPNRVPMLGIPGKPHPYQTYELLTKIFNNVTVRSNVFAVWLTVGFFEVTDEKSRPIKLGAELGRADGRIIRHRMFAVVDRSVLVSNPGPQPRFDPRAALPPALATGPVVRHFSIID